MHSELNPSRKMLSSACEVIKEQGDIVLLGDNAGVEYEIVHIEGETAWIRQPVTFRGETLVSVDRLRWVRSGDPLRLLVA